MENKLKRNKKLNSLQDTSKPSATLSVSPSLKVPDSAPHLQFSENSTQSGRTRSTQKAQSHISQSVSHSIPILQFPDLHQSYSVSALHDDP